MVEKKLAENIASTRYQDLPVEVVEQTKKEMLDVVGCMIGGIKGPEAVSVGKGNAAQTAGLVEAGNINYKIMQLAVAARAEDYDPVNDETGDHAPLATVLSALSVAKILKDVPGKKILLAIALGDDLVLRIRKGTSQKLGSHPWVTGTFASLAAAATAAKLLCLNKEQVKNALGLAYTTCSNTVQGLIEGTSSYKLHHGWAIRSGIEAAFYARQGITGVQNFLEGKYGLYNVYHGGDYNRDRITEDLGKFFHGVTIGFKPYPCCRLMHGAIDGALEIYREFSPDPEQIDRITVRVNTSALTLCGKQPWISPTSPEDLRFNIPYGVAAALFDGYVGLGHFKGESLTRDNVINFCQNVEVIVEEDLNRYGQIAPTIIEVMLKSGRCCQTRTEIPRGHPDNPMDFTQLSSKFGNICSESGANMSSSDQNIIIETIGGLEGYDSSQIAFIDELFKKI